ncbi:MAG: M48 family metallopeptidase [Candidatus Gracilibacteria bacterium]
MSPPIHIEYVRKRHSSAYVRNGEVILRISSFLSESERKIHIDKLLSRILPKLSKMEQGTFILRQILKNSRADFVHNKSVDIFVSWGARNMIIVEETKIVFKISKLDRAIHLVPVSEYSDHITLEMIIKALLSYARKYLQTYVEEVIAEWTDYFGYKKLENVQIRHNESRWGSCSGGGNISISLKTLLLPEELFEYVCVHEVAHLQQMNHSDKFWSIVESAMPHWKELRAEMKKYR